MARAGSVTRKDGFVSPSIRPRWVQPSRLAPVRYTSMPCPRARRRSVVKQPTKARPSGAGRSAASGMAISGSAPPRDAAQEIGIELRQAVHPDQRHVAVQLLLEDPHGVLDARDAAEGG